jgi:hypothetical protein
LYVTQSQPGDNFVNDDIIAKYLCDRESLTDDELQSLVDLLSRDPQAVRSLHGLLEVDDLLSRTLSVDRRNFPAQMAQKIRDLAQAGTGSGKRETLLASRSIEKRNFKKSFAQRYVGESFKANWGLRVVAALAASGAVIAGGYWLLNRNVQENLPGYVPAVSAMAMIQSSEGQVEITRAGKTVYAATGVQIMEQDMVVASSNGRAEVKYGSEETTIQLLPGATAKFWLENDAKRVRLEAGALVCRIAKQPQGKGMHFITPHVEAMVVGTQLKLAISNDETHLDVIEGSVKLAKNDQQFVMVGTGESAVAGAKGEIKVQPSTPVPSTASTPVVNANSPMVSPTSYYAQWSNGIPSDPGFFPIFVWEQDAADAKTYKDVGVNMYIKQCGVTEADLKALSEAGMKVICDQTDESLRYIGDKTIAGWLSYVQPDITEVGANNWRRPAMDPASILKRYSAYRTKDSSRPVYLIFSEGVVRDDYPARNERRNHPEDYREFAKGADILGLNVLPVNESQPPVRSNPWYVAKATDNLRASSENAKPVWCAIETTRMFPESPAKPTPEQVKAEVWMALIHGANGIGYVGYSRVPSYQMGALLKDKVMLAKIFEINRQIASLAPVLNSATVPDGATVKSSNAVVPVDLMVKKHGGSTYIFAVAMRDGATTATFTVPSGDHVEVFGENRALVVNGGKFSDQFDSYAVRIYKLSASLQAKK